jgi:predicted RNA-binding protein with PIN domain
MTLLIDGYNLLHCSGLIGRASRPGGLERARRALLDFLSAALDPREREQTTVVFDAKDAPAGLPNVLRRRGITVRYAAEWEEADDLIETLIRSDSAPRRLTVVSSDHRLQQAARRRKATAVDSERWFAEVERRRKRGRPVDRPEPKPPAPLSEEEVQSWLREFGDAAPGWRASREALPTEDDDLANPFPPGYGEDLLQDEA